MQCNHNKLRWGYLFHICVEEMSLNLTQPTNSVRFIAIRTRNVIRWKLKEGGGCVLGFKFLDTLTTNLVITINIYYLAL